MKASEQDAICCPMFNPDPWDDKLHEREHKKIIEEKVLSVFYMPINFGSIMKRLNKIVRKANANMPDSLCLSDHTSRWNMDIYLAVDTEISEAKNTSLSGRFYSKVYEGPFKATAKWCAGYENQVHAKGLKSKKQCMWYTTCPQCAKKYGKNYVAILSQIE